MAYRLLFPLATLNALVAVPLWLVLRSRHPAVIGATWHGHEMLFGFALAVIAGFLSTRPIRTVVWILAGTWFAARIAAATGSGPAAFIVGMTFPVAVFMLAAPPCSPGPSVGRIASCPQYSSPWLPPMRYGGSGRQGSVSRFRHAHC
jgi:uncharacterized protein involved in response to NO